MKKNIHPHYYKNSHTTCSSCSTVYGIGSTVESMTVEVCGNCHPYYTGKYRVLDSTGRVEKFNKKYSKFLNTAVAPKEESSAETN